jgi:von Willebrand factor A domain-containing protein 7
MLSPRVPHFGSLRILSVAALFVAIVVLTVTGSCRVLAFFPTNFSTCPRCTFGGVLGRSHERITTDAITSFDQSAFAAATLTRSMKQAIQDIVDANALVDQDQNHSSRHFDGESFPEGQALIASEFATIKTDLANSNTAGARFALGQALHSIQDFYSHSNWVETMGSSPNPSLGVPRVIIGRLPQGTATCFVASGSLVTPSPGLTSGYYGGEDRPKPSDGLPLFPAGQGKCRHGGPFDLSPNILLGGGINKDSFDLDFSPNGLYHFVAADAATQATVQFLNQIKNDPAVTSKQLKLLFGVGGTLTISIDTTGSMGDIIDAVKQQAIQIVDSRIGTPNEPSKYVLAPFNDPTTGPVTVTDDPDVFKSAISALFASGGGDCPELSMTGMLQGLAASDDGGDLFMFTDASSKDASLAGNVSALATSKNIQIYPMVFGSCSPLDPAYIRVASDSGGQLFFLQRFEGGAVTQLADLVVRPNSVNLSSFADTLAGTPKTFGVPINAGITTSTISISGTTAATVVRSDGSTVKASDPGTTIINLSTGVIFSSANPIPGIWNVTVNGSGNVSLIASGESDIQFPLFRFVSPGGRPGHEGVYPIDGFPIAGQTATVEAKLDGVSNAPQFQLQTQAGSILQSFALTSVPGTTNEFAGTITVPNVPFVVSAGGTDSSGTVFQRIVPAPVRPQTVQVLSPAIQSLLAGQTTTYVFQINDLGPNDTFKVMASDDRGYVASVGPSSVLLSTGGTANVSIQLTVPADVSGVSSDTLTVTATSPTTGASNFAILTSPVTLNRPPDVSQAAPSTAILWPPNHRMVAISIVGVTDPDGDPFSIQITGIAQDEPTNGLGDGDTCPDGQGINSATAQLRAERSGTGNGRVYTITFTATDSKGASTMGSVRVFVPHDMAGAAVDDGANFDSTKCSL